MNNQRVLILGATGMLGTMVYAVFANNSNHVIAITYNTTPLSYHTNQLIKDEYQFSVVDDGDLENKTFKLVNSFKPNYIINCIGHINTENDEKAMLANAIFPHILSNQSRKVNKAIKIIHISTDGIFDGIAGGYTEQSTDFCNSIYAKTKRLGEVDAENVLSFRCSIFGFAIIKQKSLLNWFLQQPPNAVINGFENYYWNGISTLQYAQYCLYVIDNNLFADYRKKSQHLHLILNQTVTKYQMLLTFKTVFNRNDIVINSSLANKKIDRTLKSIYLPHQNNSFENVVTAFKQFIINTPLFSQKSVNIINLI